MCFRIDLFVRLEVLGLRLVDRFQPRRSRMSFRRSARFGLHLNKGGISYRGTDIL